MKKLHISHSIFLTSEERFALAKKPHTVETVGFSIPYEETKSDVKLSEIFCKYYLTNETGMEDVEIAEDGYRIYVPDITKWDKIKEVPENEMWYQHVIETIMDRKHHRYLVTNQIVVQSVDELERSTFCENLAQYLNRTN